MTVIAGYTDGAAWAIASDSGLFEVGSGAGEYTNLWWPASEPKVWVAGDSLLGMSGSGTAGDVAKTSKIGDPHKLAEHLRGLREQGVSPEGDWDIMVVTQKGVYMVWQDFSVDKMRRPYHASGAASAPAMGALSVASLLRTDPLKAARLAAQAAIDHHTAARGPVTALALPKRKKTTE